MKAFRHDHQRLPTCPNAPKLQYYPSIRRNIKYIFSFSAVVVMCAVVIIVLIATIAYRIAVNTALLAARKEEGDESYSSAGAAAVLKCLSNSVDRLAM